MVHTTQISTTRSMPPLSFTTHRRLHRALSILQHRPTTSNYTTTTKLRDSSEHTHIHLHEPTNPHARTADASRTTHLRYLPCAQPPTTGRQPTQRRGIAQCNEPMDSGGGARTRSYLPSACNYMDRTTRHSTTTLTIEASLASMLGPKTGDQDYQSNKAHDHYTTEVTTACD